MIINERIKMTEKTYPIIKNYTTEQLVDQLYANYLELASEGATLDTGRGNVIYSLKAALVAVAEGGIDQLVEAVNWTNQLVEAKRKDAAWDDYVDSLDRKSMFGLFGLFGLRNK